MSSRRLLVVLENLSDKSPFKKAFFRDFPDQFDWPREDHLRTGLWNEIKAMRGDLWAFLGNEQMPFKPVLPPSGRREADKQIQDARKHHDRLIAQLGGQAADTAP